MTVAPIDRPAHLPVPLSVEMQQLKDFVNMIAPSGLLPYHLRGKPADVAIIVLYGAELGLRPMQAINSIAVVNGRPNPMGKLLLARARQAGHKVRIEQEPGVRCTVRIERKDDPGYWHEGAFSLEQAIDAKLVQIKDGKPYARSNKGEPLPWELYTDDMLLWRATSRAANTGCPEILLGLPFDEDTDQRPYDGPDVLPVVDSPPPAEPDVPVAIVVEDLRGQVLDAGDAGDVQRLRELWAEARTAGALDAATTHRSGHECTIVELITAEVKRIENGATPHADTTASDPHAMDYGPDGDADTCQQPGCGGYVDDPRHSETLL